MVQTNGSAGLPFVDDILKLLNDQWIPGNSNKPEMSKIWEEKVAGLGARSYRKLYVTLDAESANIFSLMQTDVDNTPFWDWMHDVSVTIEVRTSTTDEDALKIINEATRIIKKNVLLNINNREYVQILPGTITSNHEQFRGLFRYTMDISALRYNP